MFSSRLNAVGLILSAATVCVVSHSARSAITYDKIALTGDAVPGAAPGVTFSSFGSINVINDAGQVSFVAFLTGTGVNGFNNSGLYSGTSASLGQVAREGSQAPGAAAGVNFSIFDTPVINNAGQTAFLGTLTGTGVIVANNKGVFSEAGGSLGLVARGGSAAPGTPAGVNFTSNFSELLFNNAGQAAFRNVLAGTGVDSTNNSAIFSQGSGTLDLVARGGDAAPGTGPGVNFTIFESPVMNNAGQAAFMTVLTGTGVDSTNDRAIFSEAGGTLGLVARKGDTAPGAGPGWRFSYLYTPAINDLGQTAFTANMINTDAGTTYEAAIFSEAGGTLGVVARESDTAPGTGAQFNGFFNPVINNTGQTAFLSGLIGTGVVSTNNNGIFSEFGGTLGLVAREGDAAPGTEPGVIFGGTTYTFTLPVLNDAGQTAFIANLTGAGVTSSSDKGIFATDMDGVLQLIAREGDLFDVDPDTVGVDNRTISIVNLVEDAGGSDGRSTSFNNNGQLVFRLVFTDGSQGVFIANVPEPTSLALLAVGGLLLSRRRCAR